MGFKIKRDSQNQPVRFKARLVAKGYNQKEGIDNNERFAHVIKQQALKLFLAISLNKDAEVHHIDITTAFLNGDIDQVYINPPEGQMKHSNQIKF